MGARSVLILAELADGERSAVEQDCKDRGLEVTWLTSADMVGAKLISGKYDALVVHLQTPGAARACVEARTALSRLHFPVMVLAERADDESFNKAFRVGADDLVLLGASAKISQRLMAIPKPGWKSPGQSRGEALIVDADMGRADILGRLLKEAGYLVKSVRDETTAKIHLGRPSVRLVVIDATAEDIPRLIADGNRREWQPAWVVRTRPAQMDEVSTSLASFRNAIAVNAYLTASDILYAANQLSEAGDRERRLLYGTTVAFSSDSQWRESGFTFSVSLEALVVRTLALPPGSELQLELTPPGSEQPLLLSGELVERRLFGPLQAQTSPPGFTVRLRGGQLLAWQDAFRSACQQRYGVAATDGLEVPAAPVKSQAEVVSDPAAAATASIPLAQVTTASAKPSAGTEKRPATGQSRRSHAATLKSIDASTKAPGSHQDSPSTQRGVAPPPAIHRHPRAHVSGSAKNRVPRPTGAAEAPSAPAERKPVDARLQTTMLSEVPDPAGELTTKPPPVDVVNPAERVPIEEQSPLSAAITTDSIDEESLPVEPLTPVAASKQSEPLHNSRVAPPVGPTPLIHERDTSSGPTASPGGAVLESATPPAAKRHKSIGMALAGLVLLGAIGVGAVLWQRPTPRGSTGDPALTAERQAPVPLPPPSPPITPDSPGADSQLVEAPNAIGAKAGPTPSGSAAIPALDPAPSELPGHLGYLFVASPLETQVYVQGELAGETNAPLKSFCGRRYIRLGSAPGHWQSPGITYKIGCQKLNQLTIEPDQTQ